MRLLTCWTTAMISGLLVVTPAIAHAKARYEVVPYEDIDWGRSIQREAMRALVRVICGATGPAKVQRAFLSASTRALRRCHICMTPIKQSPPKTS